MSFWKVLGGAAAGVAAVVALPVAGPIGAVTAVGALVAGSIGAAAGGVAEAYDDSEEKAEEKGKRKGEKEAAAKYEKKYKKLRKVFEHAQEQMKVTSDYFNLVLAMEAVGMACAACDGEVSEEERKDINEFISGISSGNFPKDIKQKIENIANNPPNIKTAFEMANKVGLDSFELFNEIIEVVMHSDGYIHENEKAFQQAWNELVIAA